MKTLPTLCLALVLWLMNSLLIAASMWPENKSFTLPPLTGNIQVKNRQLIIDNTPFVIKGVCYEPVRKGETIPSGIMTLTPKENDLKIIEQDFQMMEAAGINTIRTYTPITDLRILTLLGKYHLHTIVPICPSYQYSQDIATLSTTIDLLKNDPSTLIWELGNEWNFNNILVGGCVFEWWKCDADNTDSPSTHDVGGWVDPGEGPWPDHCHDGEWFGIVDIDRNPRPAYYNLQALFTKRGKF